MTTDKIYLVGFMGAGKSTVAHSLADTLGWTVEDTDRSVEALERRSIQELFIAKGEAYFRAREKEVLQGLTGVRRAVVATGGGTFVEPTNRQLINEDGASVWLDVSFETVVRRVPSDGRRPLATDPDAMRTLWETRRPAYALAHFRVATDTIPVNEVVQRILEWQSSI